MMEGTLVSLAGKVALVTGAAMGIGRAVCQALLEKKIKVCITDINEDEGVKTLKEFMLGYGEHNVMFAKVDTTDQQQFETAMEAAKKAFGHLDILVNNAGIGDESNWEKIIDINLKGTLRGTLLAMKHLVDKDGVKGGTVINTASILGLKGNPYCPAYSASKHGVVGLTKCWGDKCNVAETNVKVNAVCPEAVDTVLLDNAANFSINEKKTRPMMEFIRQSSISPNEAAAAYVQLLEEDITGALLIVGNNGTHYYEPQPVD